MKTWITTDLHLQHANMHLRPQDFGNRPDNYEVLIRDRHNEVISPGDLVICLGDVIFGDKSKLPFYMAELQGNWVLVRGNHDSHHDDDWWISCGFKSVYTALVYHGVLFTHVPQPHLVAGAVLNVHGHFHNTDHRTYEYPTFPHNKLLAIEHTDYYPVEFEAFTGQKIGKKHIRLI